MGNLDIFQFISQSDNKLTLILKLSVSVNVMSNTLWHLLKKQITSDLKVSTYIITTLPIELTAIFSRNMSVSTFITDAILYV
jgi:hypothetical protein